MTDPAIRFRLMSERITHNAAFENAGKFGGAAVIIPPADSNIEPIEFLIDDASGDPAQFYSTLLTRIQIALEGIKDSQRGNKAFGR